MTEENVSILRVDTGEAVKSVNDLRENIKLLKSGLGELEIGSDAYKDTLKELKINQNALKDAMYATTGLMKDVAAAATGASKSYNSLVHQMAALKEEWRATNDEARRGELGQQIAEINQQLKDMDASVGNFSRNVGNYTSGVAPLVAKFDEWGGFLKQMPPTLGAAKKQIGEVGESMMLVGKQPILGIIGLLAPIIIKITESLKENKTAMDAIKKLMEALQPVFDILQGVLNGIATGVANVVEWFVELVGQSDGIKKVVSSIIGVGNSILQYFLAPIKSAVAAFKGLGKIIEDVFKGNWSEIKTHAKQTGKEIADAYKEGFSFKSNFEEGKVAGSKFVDGVAANKEKAKETGKELAKAVKEGFDEWEDEQRALANEEAYNAELQKQLDATEAYQQGLNERMWNGLSERLNMQEEIQERLTQAEAEEAEIRKQIARDEATAKMATMQGVANATSNIMSSIADIMESDEKNNEKNAKKIKALRIASATIDMLNGAVMAYSSAMQLGPIAGPIVGAANAAAVVAMGIANINRIKSTNPGSNATLAPAAVSAPEVETAMPSVRNVTSASEEERLNRMASPQKVYILQSDIEAAGEQSKALVEESSF